MFKEFGWFLLLLLFLFVAWIATGGPGRAAYNRTHPFMLAPAPIDDGKVYNLQELRDRTRP